MIRSLVVSAVLVATLPAPANAACVCRCINGQNQPVCSQVYEVPPICPPTVCMVAPPSVDQVQPYRLPPIGTSRCRREQVFDNDRGWIWTSVCD